MRATPRPLPLSLCIAMALSAPAAFAGDDPPPNWRLCPVGDAVPAFQEAKTPAPGSAATRATQATDIESDSAVGTEDKQTQFDGHVLLQRADQFLGSDKLTYDTEHDRYVAEGNIRYQDQSMRIVAKHAEGDQNTNVHRIDDIDYQLMSRRGNGAADRVELAGDKATLFGGTFSTCPPEKRDWELRAGRIDIDNKEGMGVARNAVLRVGKVPVLYVPWFAFPTDERRRTGLLFPSLSNSSRNGLDYRQPIYINLAPNYDMTLNPRLMTARGLLLGTQFRYLNPRGAGELNVGYMPSDKLRDRWRGHFSYNAAQNLSANWQARAGLMWISDPRYFEDFNNSVYGVSIYSAYSSAGLYGRGRYWDATVMADRWQLADYTLTEASLPYNRLPRLAFRWEQPYRPWLRAGVESEAVRFQHPVLAAGSRVDLRPYLAMDLEGGAWFLRPTLAWRYTAYNLDQRLAQVLGRKTHSRSLPIASVDTGLYFDRQTSWGGTGYLQTLEPRLFYLRVPYRDQRDFPVFDTGALTFSWGQLFRDNRYSGADRQADANQLTLALSTRLLRESDGREKLSASIGQIRYFDDSRVTLPGEQPIAKGKSAWVADFNYAINDRWQLGASYQWNPSTRRRDLTSVRTRYLLQDDGIINFAYRYRRGLLEQTDLSFLYPLNPAWSLVGRHYYSLLDHKPLETIAGVQWDSCCVAIRVVGRRYVHNRQGDLANGIMLEVELKGLGSGGQDTRRVLRRAILGYNRDDLYLAPPETPTAPPVIEDPDPTP